MHRAPALTTSLQMRQGQQILISYSDFIPAGSVVTNYRFGPQWHPLSSLTLRLNSQTLQEAARALPTISTNLDWLQSKYPNDAAQSRKKLLLEFVTDPFVVGLERSPPRSLHLLMSPYKPRLIVYCDWIFNSVPTG